MLFGAATETKNWEFDSNNVVQGSSGVLGEVRRCSELFGDV